MPNVVNIVVTSTNRTQEGIGGANKALAALKAAAVTAGVAVGAALADMAVKSVKMASSFDAQMTQLSTQAGVATNQIGVLSRGVLDLAGQVGQSPTSLAQALFHVESNFASLGISSQKALSLLKVAAEGASVGGANLTDVTNALTAAVASGIPGVQDFNKAMGILNATVGAGDMTMQDLANAFSSGLLATVKGFGLSITDVSAALATFGDNNVRGAVAATDLRTAVQALAVPAASGKKQLQDWGVASNQLALDMQQHGLLFALEHLQELFKQNGISAQQQGDIITQMFGKKAGAGLNILMGQMDRLQSKYPDLAKGADQFASAWQKTQGTFKQQMADMRAAFDSLLIRIGERLIPLIQSWIPKMVEGWHFVVNVIKELNSVFHFDVMMADIKDQWGNLMEKFRQDWPHLKILVIAVIAAVATLALGILALIDGVLRLDQIMVGAWARIGDALTFMVKTALANLKMFAEAAASALGWLPGIGPQVKGAAKSIEDFVDSANKSLSKLVDPTVTVTVVSNVVGSLAGSALAAMSGHAYGGIATSAQHAYGGIAAAAQGAIGSGLTMVGERGPEIIRAPIGSHVIPNGSVGGTLAASGIGSMPVIRSEIVLTGNVESAFGAWFQSMLRSGKITIRQRYITT